MSDMSDFASGTVGIDVEAVILESTQVKEPGYSSKDPEIVRLTYVVIYLIAIFWVITIGIGMDPYVTSWKEAISLGFRLGLLVMAAIILMAGLVTWLGEPINITY